MSHENSSRSGLSALALLARLAVVTQLRRVGATVMLVLLPVAFFVSLLGQSDGGSLGGMVTGSCWATSITALFGVRANRGLDIRTTGLGLGSRTIFFGRLIGFWVIALVLSVLLAVIARFVDGVSIKISVVAMILASVVAIPFGALIAVSRLGETEGSLLVLGIFGIPFSFQFNDPNLRYFPSYGAMRYAYSLGTDVSASWIIHPIVIGVVVSILAALVWQRGLRRGAGLD